MTPRTLVAALLAAAALFAATGVHARDTGVVSFCYNDWPPYSRTTADGPAGISIDVMREAARRTGLTASFRELPWNRCLEMVRQGRIDAVLDAAPRDEFRQVETSYSVYTNTLWVHGDSPIEKLDFLALHGMTIGLIDGYWYPEDLSARLAAAEMEIDMSVDDATAARKLAAGRIDVYIGDRANTGYLVRRGGLEIRPLSPDHSADPLYTAFNAERDQLRDTIGGALAAMKADGTLDAIRLEHLVADPRAAGSH